MGGWNKGKGRSLQWLLDHVDYDGQDCLTWPFAINRFWGRGSLGVEGRVEWAHRYMCKLVHGDPPPDKPYAAHECGNGHLACVHPKHIFWKTISENAIDRRVHGRPEGAKGSRTRLTADQVAEIRNSKGKVAQFSLAEKFGISRASIEYWQRTNHDPRPLSDHKSNVSRRKARRTSRKSSRRAVRFAIAHLWLQWYKSA